MFANSMSLGLPSNYSIKTELGELNLIEISRSSNKIIFLLHPDKVFK